MISLGFYGSSKKLLKEASRVLLLWVSLIRLLRFFRLKRQIIVHDVTTAYEYLLNRFLLFIILFLFNIFLWILDSIEWVCAILLQLVQISFIQAFRLHVSNKNPTIFHPNLCLSLVWWILLFWWKILPPTYISLCF